MYNKIKSIKNEERERFFFLLINVYFLNRLIIKTIEKK